MQIRERVKMNDTFASWLASGDMSQCCFQEKRYSYIMIRVEKSPDFEYLFSQRRYDKEGLKRDTTFKYAGIYCRKDGLLYDAEYDLTSIADDPEQLKSRSAETLKEHLKTAVRKKVEAVISGDRSNLQISKLTDNMLLSDLDYVCRYSAKETARRLYLDTADFDLPAFSCHYEPDRWKEDSLLAYILDPEGYAEKEATAYMTANQENMLYDFLTKDAILKEYQAILEDQENLVHTVKKIMDVMRTTSAKTVNVTVKKEGVEFTFKTEADILRRDCTSYYGTWQMAASDRRKFEQTFGRSADYRPEEILRITYARNVLYEAGK